MERFSWTQKAKLATNQVISQQSSVRCRHLSRDKARLVRTGYHQCPALWLRYTSGGEFYLDLTRLCSTAGSTMIISPRKFIKCTTGLYTSEYDHQATNHSPHPSRQMLWPRIVTRTRNLEMIFSTFLIQMETLCIIHSNLCNKKESKKYFLSFLTDYVSKTCWVLFLTFSFNLQTRDVLKFILWNCWIIYR